jgi:glycosidase
MAATAVAMAATAGTYQEREADWRNGAVVYQVLVDRFAPSQHLAAKRDLYAPPRRLRDWSEVPTVGPYDQLNKVGSHELDFWGGDFDSLRGRLDHIAGLGAQVLYLNPIHLGFTNHKYDSLDFKQISPEYGTRDDVVALAAELHRRGMKLVLDGVFNHMGRNAPAFRSALAAFEAERAGRPAPEGTAAFRHWFTFDAAWPGLSRNWKNVANLPELNLENPAAVRDHLWATPDSVVRGYLRDGADGWRLDTAYELGPAMLSQLTEAAHREKPGSLVVGEIVNYPAGWSPAMDGVMNFHARMLIFGLVRGEMAPATAGRMLERMVGDTGIEPMLKSWLLLDNHDVRRIATELPDAAQRRIAQVLQFTLPGAPNLYYGSEVGMTGGEDPAQRGPMRWDLVSDAQPELAWTRQLVAMHRQHRALRVGDFRLATSERLLAFERHTDRAADTVLVIVNPGDQPVTEAVQWRNGQMMDADDLRDLIPPPAGSKRLTAGSGLVRVTMPPRSVRVLAPVTTPGPGGYSVYKRMP